MDYSYVKLKKTQIIIFLFLSISFTGFSQNLRFGIFFAPQLSWMSPDVKSIDKDVSKLGINAGLIIDRFFAENYIFSSGISIINSGGTLTYSDSISLRFRNTTEVFPEGVSVSYKLQYLTIPLELKFKTNKIGNFIYYGHLGLTSQICLKASADIPASNIKDESIVHEINFFNLAYHIGAGLEYSLGGNTAIIGGLIYTNGFLDITDNKNDTVTLSNIRLRIGLMF